MKAKKGNLILKLVFREIFFLYLFLLTCALSFGQELSPTTPLTSYQQKLWRTINGTQIQRVFDLAQDSAGYLWIGTDRGLIRFDGSSSLTYTLIDHPVLKVNNVNHIEIGENNTLWLANRRGVYYLKDNVIKEIKLNNSSIRRTMSIALDKNQKLWVASRSGKLYTIENFEATEIKPFKEPVYKVYNGFNNSVWITSRFDTNVKLWKINEEGEFIEKKMNKFIPGLFNSISENKDGTLAIGIYRGQVYKVKGEEVELICSKPNEGNFARAIVINNDESIWYGDFYNGLNRYYKGKEESFSQKKGLGSDDVYSLFFDRDGNLWVGTATGLNYFSRTPFQQIVLNDDKPVHVYCFLADSDLILVGSKNGLLELKNDKLYRLEGLSELGDEIRTLSKTNIHDEYLVGTTLGLFRIKKTNSSFSVVEKLSAQNIKMVNQRKNGEIWFAERDYYKYQTEYLNVSVIVKGVKHRVVELDGKQIQSMYEDSKGKFWIATSEGLFYCNSYERELKVQEDEFLESKFIMNIVEDRNNDLWVGTYGSGLVKITDSTQAYYDTRQGLPVNQVFHHFKSNKKGLWFWASNHEYGMLYKIVQNSLAGKDALVSRESFHLPDEIQYNGYSGFPDIAIVKDSTFYLAGTSSLIKFDPLSLKSVAPVVDIEKIIVNDIEIPKKDFVNVEASLRNFEFHYASLDFARRDNQYFEYKLEGFDERWNSVGNRRVAYYSSLPAGEYVFRVRVKGNEDNFIEMKAPLKFSKKQFWWKTRLALFTYSLIFLSMIAGFFQLRLHSLQKQRATLQLKVDERTQQLKTLNDNLEYKVKERTKEISSINEELTLSRERYQYALEASNDGIWDWNIADDTIKFSPAIYTMLGFSPYEFDESRTALYKYVINDPGNEYHIKFHEDLIKDKEHGTLLDEYKMITKQGKTIWVLSKGKIVESDENGKPLRIVGTHTNITNDKLKNKELLNAILRTEDTERSRISKDIHDGLQQTLTISLLNFQAVKKEIGKLGAKASEKFATGWEYLQSSIKDSREVAHALMPKAIVDFGIIPACENLVDSIDKANEKTKFRFYHNFEDRKLFNHQIEVTLYRILQEGINNIVKYANATEVDIQLKEYDTIYMLTIEDNGIGFDTEILKNDKGGFGFKSMQNRLDAIDGFLEVDSRIGRGTSIIVEINKS